MLVNILLASLFLLVILFFLWFLWLILSIFLTRKGQPIDCVRPCPYDCPLPTPIHKFIQGIKPIDMGEEYANTDISEIYNLIILDKSASMKSLRTFVCDGYNQVLNTIREAQKMHQEQQYFVSLVVFNHKVSTLFENKRIADVNNLSLDDYNPHGTTSMFDAIDISLTNLITQLNTKEKAVAVITIISDGVDRVSDMYLHSGESAIDNIASLIQYLKNMGCTINFMGPSTVVNDELSNAEEMAQRLHVDNFLAFEYPKEAQ